MEFKMKTQDKLLFAAIYTAGMAMGVCLVQLIRFI